MLDQDRKYYVTASQSHRVMAGFETELAGKSAVKPDFDQVDAVIAIIEETGKKPLVGALKKADVIVSGADIEAAYKYWRSQQKVFSDGMWSVAREIAMSAFIAERDTQLKTVDMERGNIQEGEAIQYLENLIDVKFESTTEDQRFLTRDNLGVTPDGVEMAGFSIKSCAEVKNPKDTTHMKYLYLIKDQYDLLKYAPEYYWQAQCGLYVTECEYYHWLSYHHEFTKLDDHRGVYVEIEPDQDHIDILVDRANRVAEKVPEIINDILSRI